MLLLSKTRPSSLERSALRTWLPVGGALLLSLAVVPVSPGQSGKGGSSTIVETELSKRLEAQERARILIAEGDTLAAQGKHCDAADRYRDAANALRPGAPSTAALRADAVKKLAKSGVICAKELAATGAYDQARVRLETILEEDKAPNDKAAQKLLKELDDPDRYNPSLTTAHTANVKKTAKLLRMAEDYVGLAQFDTAEAAYNQVLAIDSTNTAARRGLEAVERHKTEYYKSARDETRIRMLNDVDRVWEPKVPSLTRIRPEDLRNMDTALDDRAPVSVKLRTLVLPRLSLSEATIADAVAHLAKKSAEIDPAGHGVNIVWNPAGGGSARTVTVDMRNITMEEALRAVCDSAGVRFRTEASVVIVSMNAGSGMETRQFRVPPGFLSTAASAVPTEAAADPFATPDAGAAKPKIGRLDAKTYLENQNIPFPPGARASYNAASNALIVINTPENLDIIANLVEGLVGASQRQALIEVVLLKTTQTNMHELGMDALMEGFSIGGSDRLFGMGGTFGNQEWGGTANQPGNFGSTTFQPVTVPFNVIQGPLTAGLRSSWELTRTQSIDDLIARSNNASGASVEQNRSPYIAGVGGLFTSPRFQALLRGLDQKKGVDLSVANKIIVKSGQRASAFSGRDFSYPTEFDPPQIPQTVQAPQFDIFDPTTGIGGTLTGTLGQPPVTPATPSSFETKQIGSSIEVEAIIGEDGVTMDLNLAVSFTEFDGFINYGTPITTNDIGSPPQILTDNRITQPVFSKAAATTQVLIYDGQTVAIGGLTGQKTDTVEDKVPVWGSLPIVGRFFKTRMTRDSRSAVIYFVTVHIIDPSGENVRSTEVAVEPPATVPEQPVDPDVLNSLRADSGK